jgi:transcriptional regulator with XRE-family HTH domain
MLYVSMAIASAPAGEPQGIGKRIHDLRRARGLTIAVAARAAGIAPSWWYQQEYLAVRRVPPKTLEKIAAALGVPVEDIIGCTTSPTQSLRRSPSPTA